MTGRHTPLSPAKGHGGFVPENASWQARLARACAALFKDSNRASLDLFKVMVPVILVVKLLKELGLVHYLAMPLEPVMELMGLPAQTGLVWATSMLTNLYSGIVVYAALLPEMSPVSVAQVTVLATVLLIAHNLLVELRIAQGCGLSLRGQAALRIGAALLAGALMNLLFSGLGILQEPSAMLFTPAQEEQTLARWGLTQLTNFAAIYCIVLVIMGMMRVLQHFRITDLINLLLRPILKLMNIGPQAATITVIGLTLGIAYGGGLIIHEVKQGHVPHKDVFASMSLMGLSHALIEDTLLMALIGANTLGTLWFRLVFSLIAVAVLARLYGARQARITARANAHEAKTP